MFVGFGPWRRQWFVGFRTSWHLSSVLPTEATIYSLDFVGVDCVVGFAHKGSYRFAEIYPSWWYSLVFSMMAAIDLLNFAHVARLRFY